MLDFIEIRYSDDDVGVVAASWPADETVVDVLLADGTVTPAWFSSNIMDAGDFDFMPVGDDGEPLIDANSIADKVIAWRPSA